LPRQLTGSLSRDEMRAISPDGSHGGAYQRSDADMLTVWNAGVLEVRNLIESGWSQR
jgi:creatinine amidohydrolase